MTGLGVWAVLLCLKYELLGKFTTPVPTFYDTTSYELLNSGLTFVELLPDGDTLTKRSFFYIGTILFELISYSFPPAAL